MVKNLPLQKPVDKTSFAVDKSDVNLFINLLRTVLLKERPQIV
jgi:hypothetical protein